MMEKTKLPSHYDYLHTFEENDSNIFRIKQIKDESSAMAWLAEFSDCTKTTWRVSRTYPNSGKYNIYKTDLHCVHNTDRRATGEGPSKHTGCPAKMTITVKRTLTNSKGKGNDTLTLNYPTVVTVRGKHNHPMDTPATLKYRDLSDDIKLKFAKLFHLGHSPASALQIHKTDLMLEYGDRYFLIAADGKYLPSYSIVNHLFQEFKKEYGLHAGGKTIQLNSDNLTENDSTCELNDNSIPAEEANLPSPSNSIDLNTNQDDLLSMDEMEKLEIFFHRIREGIKKDPKNFVPAVRRFLKNVDTYGKTDSGFITGLRTFAMHSRVLSGNKASKKIVRQCHKTRTGVQSTAIGKRKLCNTGKRKTSATRPCGIKIEDVKGHAYTHFENYDPDKEFDLLKCIEEK